jgi:site-specific DNA-cytosine methylase
VVWGMNKLRHYLLGTNFTVKTDHSNLRWILEAHHIRDPQIARWRAVLSQYDFKLLYDKKVAVADALSRDARFEQVVHLVSECDMVSAITCAQVLSRDPRFEKPPDTQQQGYMAAVRCDTASGHERVCKSFDWVDPEDKMIEIGCGGGGTGIGAAAAGYVTVAGVDISAKALQVFREINPGAIAAPLDIHDRRALRRLLRRTGRVGLISITTPCAPFSTAKHGGVPLSEDLRAELLVIAVEEAAAAGPDAIVIENVVGVAKSPHWKRAKLALEEAGYFVEHTNVNAMYLGVAQNRNRFIATAVRRGLSTQVRMAAKSLTRKVTRISQILPNRKTVWHYSRDNRSPCVRSADGTYPALRPNGGYHPRPGAYKARARDAGPIEKCQPLTTKEMAALQGWPEETWAALPEGRQAAAQILGQSVPPPMAEWAARLIRDAGVRDDPIPNPSRIHKPTMAKQPGISDEALILSICGAVMTRSA